MHEEFANTYLTLCALKKAQILPSWGEISEAVVCRHLMAKKLAEKAFQIFRSLKQPQMLWGYW